MCGVLMFKRLACTGYLLQSGLDSMVGLMVRVGLCMARACVCVLVVRHSDLLTRATTVRLHIEHDYMSAAKRCKMIPARYTYASVVLRVAGRA